MRKRLALAAVLILPMAAQSGVRVFLIERRYVSVPVGVAWIYVRALMTFIMGDGLLPGIFAVMIAAIVSD